MLFLVEHDNVLSLTAARRPLDAGARPLALLTGRRVIWLVPPGDKPAPARELVESLYPDHRVEDSDISLIAYIVGDEWEILSGGAPVPAGATAGAIIAGGRWVPIHGWGPGPSARWDGQLVSAAKMLPVLQRHWQFMKGE